MCKINTPLTRKYSRTVFLYRIANYINNFNSHNTFTAQDFKGHISCLTEFEKHWGEYAKPKQKSQHPSGEHKNKQ
jgi:hypothetical protein